MKEITSKRTGKIQIITEPEYDWLVANGKAKHFVVKEIVERKLIEVPKIVPKEVRTQTKKKDG